MGIQYTLIRRMVRPRAFCIVYASVLVALGCFVLIYVLVPILKIFFSDEEWEYTK